jgi:hypothetical protein
MKLYELKEYAVKMAKENPTLKKEIYDMVNLALSEVDEGGSENHECELARRDIEFIVNEKMIEDEMEKINSPGEDKTVHGYSNIETYTMISHIHNNQDWIEDAFDNIRRYNNPNNLKEEFKKEIFNNRGGLSDVFGKMSFERINWREIFENLKGMMPKETYEELEERLVLANRQANYLSRLLHDLKDNCNGYGSLPDEMSTIHNIKLLTDLSNDQWKYQD